MSPTVPVPILVRRTEPAQVARNWPPPLDMPHRCGTVTLAAVHFPVASIEAATDIYARLLNVEAPLASPASDHTGKGCFSWAPPRSRW